MRPSISLNLWQVTDGKNAAANLASFERLATPTRRGETRADTSMGKQTKVFLEDLTAEKLVHLGLLADAFDEALNAPYRAVDTFGV